MYTQGPVHMHTGPVHRYAQGVGQINVSYVQFGLQRPPVWHGCSSYYAVFFVYTFARSASLK